MGEVWVVPGVARPSSLFLMLTSRRDYILRIIDEVGRLLARVIFKRRSGEQEEALQAIVQPVQRAVGTMWITCGLTVHSGWNTRCCGLPQMRRYSQNLFGSAEILLRKTTTNCFRTVFYGDFLKESFLTAS